jgi:hypothetical protein
MFHVSKCGVKIIKPDGSTEFRNHGVIFMATNMILQQRLMRRATLELPASSVNIKHTLYLCPS